MPRDCTDPNTVVIAMYSPASVWWHPILIHTMTQRRRSAKGSKKQQKKSNQSYGGPIVSMETQLLRRDRSDRSIRPLPTAMAHRAAARYLETLCDPFSSELAKIPDNNCARTACAQIYAISNVQLSASGEGGLRIKFGNGQINSVANGIGAVWASENPATTTSSAFTYLSDASFAGGSTLASLANSVRVVSAGVQLWSEQAPNTDSGAVIGLVLGREDLATPPSGVSGLMNYPYAIRTQVRKGIKCLFRPTDYIDWAFGVVNNVPLSAISTHGNNEVYIHITGGVANATYQFAAVCNVEYTPAPTVMLPDAAPSPMDPIGHAKILDLFARFVPTAMPGTESERILSSAMKYGAQVLGDRLLRTVFPRPLAALGSAFQQRQ
jgi:hypothetical protein